MEWVGVLKLNTASDRSPHHGLVVGDVSGRVNIPAEMPIFWGYRGAARHATNHILWQGIPQYYR